MQKCENCNMPFSWGKITKSIGWLYKPINCGTKHKITFLSRCRVVALGTLPFFVFTYFLTPFNTYNVNIGIALLIAIFIILIAPYVVKYRRE
ncbi:hypothetical protein D1B31_15435 [Neobacillus notoginsengisoli]|uniref:CXXC-20-CXXC protein n=1 Tax=Neobacillus notoginsengisoli TaxID=1578198 RepID=A0A417YS95_9BACI|nr:hypothetical protein [Neobacillus notoginsengisoli]RHW38161.1 hypothetical protein D1B31_15435 [Neobacillus notoginsengisoli]